MNWYFIPNARMPRDKSPVYGTPQRGKFQGMNAQLCCNLKIDSCWNPAASAAPIGEGFISCHTGYVYHVKTNLLGQSVNQWLPFDVADASAKSKLAYSIYISKAPVGVDDRIEKASGLKVFPNPSNDLFNVQYSLSQSEFVQLEVVDMQGKSLLRKVIGKEPAGEHMEVLNLLHFPSGLYFCKLQYGDHVAVQKIMLTDQK